MAAKTIKAIETSYGGCRFRSRLEARWAVFFDQLRIQWQYEPEGFRFDGYNYLPDFYLPEMDIFCEVKGTDEALGHDEQLLAKFAHSLGRPRFLVVLGEVPEVWPGGVCPTHAVFTADDRQVMAIMIGQNFHQFVALNGTNCCRTRPAYIAGVHPAQDIADAYNYARSARFEHGECP